MKQLFPTCAKVLPTCAKVCLALHLVVICCGASYRTTNFLVTARSVAQAKAIARAAEHLRRDLAVSWLGRELPDWTSPCPIRVTMGDGIRPNGATSYTLRDGTPQDWEMKIEGSRRALFESVLPHEVSHTVIATHFRRPIPRWAEEGLCVIVEAEHERKKLERTLAQHLRRGSVYAIHRIFAMNEYPSDVVSFYSQGYSLVQFLVQRGGRRKFIIFLDDALYARDWAATARKHYGFASLDAFESAWLQWVHSAANVPLVAPPESLSDAR